MNLLKRLRTLLNGNCRSWRSNRQKIVINSRSDGLSEMGIPVFVAPWILNFARTLKCIDGTDFPIRTTSSLVTGTSAYKHEILKRQIVSGILDGFTPIVLSNDGQQGEVFNILRTIYPECAVNYISEYVNSGYYNPFGHIPNHCIVEFFYQMVMDLQQQIVNGMLVRNYIDVCVRVFFCDANTVGRLISGQLNHTGLLQEIQHLYQNNFISEQTKVQLENMANSAQSVSVAVFSMIQDYLYKLRRINVSQPTIQIHSVNSPHITIFDAGGQNLHPHQGLPTNAEYDLSVINEGKCIFIQVDNKSSGNITNSPCEQCFQWYLSKTLQMEINAKPEIRNGRILLIIENISSTVLDWFWWLIDLPNCVLLLNYEDFYSKVADSQEHRQQLIGKMDRIYFFSVLDEQSAGWASRIFGMHKVPKSVITKSPYRDWTDIFINPKTYTYDEEEQPWFSTHEIQHLGNSGIVYSKRDKVFTAYYCQNGRMYKDKNYTGRHVNFCIFSFK